MNDNGIEHINLADCEIDTFVQDNFSDGRDTLCSTSAICPLAYMHNVSERDITEKVRKDEKSINHYCGLYRNTMLHSL